MDKLFSLHDAFGLSQAEIDRLCYKSVGRGRYAPVYSIPEAVYLAAGVSLKSGRLTAIIFPKKDKIAAWPLWNVERKCGFVLSFRFDEAWRPIYWAAEAISFLLSVCELGHIGRTDKAWEWVGYSRLAFDEGWLESGPAILAGRFRTSYPFAKDLL